MGDLGNSLASNQVGNVVCYLAWKYARKLARNKVIIWLGSS